LKSTKSDTYQQKLLKNADKADKNLIKDAKRAVGLVKIKQSE
jgi:hypothetical protein